MYALKKIESIVQIILQTKNQIVKFRLFCKQKRPLLIGESRNDSTSFTALTGMILLLLLL